jgi:hypothetical protein
MQAACQLDADGIVEQLIVSDCKYWTLVNERWMQRVGDICKDQNFAQVPRIRLPPLQP